MKKLPSVWVCYGPVRGWCGVRHRSEEAAKKHCEEDDQRVKERRGDRAYSDRRPLRFVYGQPQPREGHVHAPEIPNHVRREMGLW